MNWNELTEEQKKKIDEWDIKIYNESIKKMKIED